MHAPKDFMVKTVHTLILAASAPASFLAHVVIFQTMATTAHACQADMDPTVNTSIRVPLHLVKMDPNAQAMEITNSHATVYMDSLGRHAINLIHVQSHFV